MKKTTGYNIFRLLRPRQWIKNLALFAAITFGGQLFDINALYLTFLGFIVFCMLSSAIYVVNDIFDREKDRLHPFKRFRPIAHWDISIKQALVTVVLLTIPSFIIGFFVSPTFFVCIIVYLILQLSYSVWLKHIAGADILAIAAGYILRVYGGEFASGSHISVWLLLTTISISLFLAVGKRRSELTLVSRRSDAKI